MTSAPSAATNASSITTAAVDILDRAFPPVEGLSSANRGPLRCAGPSRIVLSSLISLPRRTPSASHCKKAGLASHKPTLSRGLEPASAGASLLPSSVTIVGEWEEKVCDKSPRRERRHRVRPWPGARPTAKMAVPRGTGKKVKPRDQVPGLGLLGFRKMVVIYLLASPPGLCGTVRRTAYGSVAYDPPVGSARVNAVEECAVTDENLTLRVTLKIDGQWAGHQTREELIESIRVRLDTSLGFRGWTERVKVMERRGGTTRFT